MCSPWGLETSGDSQAASACFASPRNKTGTLVEIETVDDLERLIDEHLAADVVRRTFVHRRDGAPYTVEGIGAMFRRYCVGTKDRPRTELIPDFGLRDLRARWMFAAGSVIHNVIIIKIKAHCLANWCSAANNP